MSSKYEFIDGEKANYPIIKMCRWAKVSKSGLASSTGHRDSGMVAVVRG